MRCIYNCQLCPNWHIIVGVSRMMIKVQTSMKGCSSNNYLQSTVGKKPFLLSMVRLVTLEFHPSISRYVCLFMAVTKSPMVTCLALWWRFFHCTSTSFKPHHSLQEVFFWLMPLSDMYESWVDTKKTMAAWYLQVITFITSHALLRSYFHCQTKMHSNFCTLVDWGFRKCT